MLRRRGRGYVLVGVCAVGLCCWVWRCGTGEEKGAGWDVGSDCKGSTMKEKVALK